VRRSPLISSVFFLLFVVVVVVVVVAIVVVVAVVLPGVLGVLLAARRSTSVMMAMAVEDFVVARMGPSVGAIAATADGDRRGVVMRILLPHCLIEPPQHVIKRVVRHGCVWSGA